MTHQRAIEAGSRALWQTSVYQGYSDETREREWVRMEGIWKRQMRAVLSALAAEGLVVVPAEPTDAMTHAAMDALDSPFYADLEMAYRAMIKEAQK